MMNKTKAGLLSTRVVEHLKAIEDELGVTFSVGRGTFDDSSFTMKLQITENGENGEKQDKMALDFKQYATLLGLHPNDLGKTINLGGLHCVLVGAKMSYRKYPIIAKKPNGSLVKLPVDDVKRGLLLTPTVR